LPAETNLASQVRLRAPSNLLNIKLLEVKEISMSTHYKGSAAEVRALNAFIKLMRASESMNTRISRRLAEAGLTVSQFGMLEALYHLGPMCQAELGRKQLRTSGNVTMVVDNLEKSGLVRRRREGSDRRYVTVHLTEKGQRLIEALFPKILRAIVREMSVLNAAEQDQFNQYLRKVGLQS
jgi:MarR family 2-MHQ and catechol resistance regulon transcriptional repressor